MGNSCARVLQWRLLSKFSEWQEGEQVREAIRSCGEGLRSRTRSYRACSSWGSTAELRAEDQHDLNCLKSAGLQTDCVTGSKGDRGQLGSYCCNLGRK